LFAYLSESIWSMIIYLSSSLTDWLLRKVYYEAYIELPVGSTYPGCMPIVWLLSIETKNKLEIIIQTIVNRFYLTQYWKFEQMI